MDNFDLKKFLTENRLTSVTRISENTEGLRLSDKVARQLYDENPNITDEDEIINLGSAIAKRIKTGKSPSSQQPGVPTTPPVGNGKNRKTVYYDKEFTSDLVTAYRDLQRSASSPVAEQQDYTGISKLTFSYKGFEEEGEDGDIYGKVVFECDQYPGYFIHIGASGDRVSQEQDVNIQYLYFEDVEGSPQTTLEL